MASAEAAVAATEARIGSVLAAALLLPGIALQARAGSAPEQGTVEVQALDYHDRQPGLDRVRVQAPSVRVLAPVGSRWAVEGALVSDAVSGASPRHHTAISGASRMSERRNATDASVTHYGERDAWSLGAAYSNEHDYRSRTVSGTYRWSTEDNNRTWEVGLARSDDAIGSSDDPTLHAHRLTWQATAGVTQAASAADLVQWSLGANLGRGDFSDPYKLPDIRPRHRDQLTSLLRWNHDLGSLDAVARLGWRWYGDSFGVRADTFDAAWVQSFGDRFQLTPNLRYTTQRAARFYFDPVYSATLGEPFPPGYDGQHDASADQRLSAFGALTAGLRLDVKLDARWRMNASVERYEQRGSWRLGGHGSPGLEPFSARWLQLGVACDF
jgi:hypothetical protein